MSKAVKPLPPQPVVNTQRATEDSSTGKTQFTPPAKASKPEVKLATPAKQASPTSLPQQQQKLPAKDDLNWSEFAFELELDALARQVVLNTVVQVYRQDKLVLGLLAEMDVMLKPEIQRQIKSAIESKLGVSLSLEFSSLDALDVETPQQAYQRKQEQARQAAITQIRQNPLVRQLNTLFAAELIESTVHKSKPE